MQTQTQILDLLAANLPGVDVDTLTRAYAAIAPHLKAPARKRKALEPAAVDVASLSDAQMFAHYKTTAPAADLAFFLATVTHAGTRAAGEALRAESFDAAGKLTIPRPEFYRRLRNLQDAWRRATTDWSPWSFQPLDATRVRVIENVAASEYARACSRYAVAA